MIAAVIALDKAVDPAGADIGDVRRRERKHRPAAVAVLIVHSADGGNPARRRLVIAARKHRRDQLRRILGQLGIRRDERRRARNERPRRFPLKPVLASPQQLSDRAQPRVGILADEGLAKLPCIGVGQVRRVGGVVDRRVKIDHRL